MRKVGKGASATHTPRGRAPRGMGPVRLHQTTSDYIGLHQTTSDYIGRSPSPPRWDYIGPHWSVSRETLDYIGLLLVDWYYQKVFHVKHLTTFDYFGGKNAGMRLGNTAFAKNVMKSTMNTPYLQTLSAFLQSPYVLPLPTFPVPVAFG